MSKRNSKSRVSPQASTPSLPKRWLSQSLESKFPALPESEKATSIQVFVFGASQSKSYRKHLEKYSSPWQRDSLLGSNSPLQSITNENGTLLLVHSRVHSVSNSFSPYGYHRDLGGAVFSQIKSFKKAYFHLEGLSPSEERGFFVGLELGAYHFKTLHQGKDSSENPQVLFNKKMKELGAAICEAGAINLARHLVNLPPNQMNPQTFVDVVTSLSFSKNMSVSVWDDKKLQSERMNLLLSVGAGSEHHPRLVHLRYRPQKFSGQPVVFVGKGITFDTGGLDIKPSSAMRLMKKDMGGAATLLGLAQWVDESQLRVACDFYFAMAENSVDSRAFRPSDIVQSRAGYRVEIDNTDAEGRLVLADALDVAVQQSGKDEPQCIVDVATLTGAIKVALGSEVAGLFSNNDNLAKKLLKACEASDDPAWRMPLVSKYFSSLSSPFADFKNSAEGFGGAITAALFLEKFVKKIPWAHFDIYAWADKSQGAFQAPGGNGQMVQGLIQFLKDLDKKPTRKSS